MFERFYDRLACAIREKRSHVVLGLDPDIALLPPELKENLQPPLDEWDEEAAARTCEVYSAFLRALLQALVEDVVAVKIQIAFFEALGWRGYQLYESTIREAQKLGYIVIADVKRGDIGNTAEAYALAHLDRAGADALTVNPYFGSDGLEPFLLRAREKGKGVYVLVKTSNESSREVQDLKLASGQLAYEAVAQLVGQWGQDTLTEVGWSCVGAVVGGTHPTQARTLRQMLPFVPFLIPGYGAQGARAEDLTGLFGRDGLGAVVNSARAILYAYRKRPLPWIEAARAEARDMREVLWKVAFGH